MKFKYTEKWFTLHEINFNAFVNFFADGSKNSSHYMLNFLIYMKGKFPYLTSSASSALLEPKELLFRPKIHMINRLNFWLGNNVSINKRGYLAHFPAQTQKIKKIKNIHSENISEKQK